jgi:uncharacterized protein (TIGR00369 family)
MTDHARVKPTLELLAKYCESFNASQALKAFGVRVEFPDLERVRVVMDPVREEHRGGLGTSAVNGGVIAAAFDLAIGCTPALIDPTKRNATMQLSMSFLKPVTGKRFHIDARIDRAGTDTLFATGHLFDEKGDLCSTCSGLVKMSTRPWNDGHSPTTN